MVEYTLLAISSLFVIVDPIATVPETFPVETFPIDTTPLDTAPLSGNKTILSGSDIVPLGDYTFTDTSDTSDCVGRVQRLFGITGMFQVAGFVDDAHAVR